MLQNLRIGTSAITLTPADSDVSANFAIPASAIQSSGNTSWTTANAVRIYNNNNTWIAPTSSGNNATINTTGTPPSQSQYIGNYYNWYTATAGTGTAAMTSGNATSSICPKGWRLPTGDTASSSFYSLVNTALNATGAAGSWKLQNSPYHFALFGYYYEGPYHQGSEGEWWTSTVINADYAVSLQVFTTSTNSRGGYNGKVSGYSVRCLAR